MRSLGASLLFVSLLAWSAPAAADDVTVEVGHNKLEPAKVTISAGDTVTFRNGVAMPGGHTVVSDDGSFRSPALGKDESWSRTFAEPGTWTYHIEQHPGAKGEIEVE